MKITIALVLTLSSCLVYGQENANTFDGHAWKAPYTLAVPAGWTIERFLIPISFAPEIPYTGVEDIRFTPGWGNAASDEYWSYAFLWYLEGEVAMDAKLIAENLKHYYTGLVAINGANIPKEKRIPVSTSFKEVTKDAGDLRTYQGTVKMTDYMGHKPIVLNGKVHVRSCPGENKTFVFYELSPQPLSHKVWPDLDALWTNFNCK